MMKHVFWHLELVVEIKMKPIHQHWEHSSQDDPKLVESTIIAVFLILMNPQLSAVSVEREDIIEGHAQML